MIAFSDSVSTAFRAETGPYFEKAFMRWEHNTDLLGQRLTTDLRIIMDRRSSWTNGLDYKARNK